MEDASPFHQAPETEQDPLSEPSPVEGSPGEEEKAEEASWRFVDHFSVGIPSTKIRFRHKRVVMYGFDNDEQILMEEDKKLGVVTVKRFPTASFGLKFLRATYTLVALLVACFLWAFCWQIIIFLFLNMAAEGGKTQADPDLSTGHVVGIIASIPLFIHGLASICAFGSTFVSDTWKGNPLFQQLMGFSNAVVMESICFLFFLGVPGVTMAVSLMAGSENWWETTLKVWVCCVLFCMAVFAILVVICEVTLCMEIITLQDENSSSRWQCVRKAILNTQIMFYSGYQKEEFLVDTMDNKHHIKTKSSLYSRLTLIGCCQNQLFEKLDPPVNSFTTDEIRDVMPFFTAGNWSLERMFCRSSNSQMVFVHKGHGSLRKGQVLCSLICGIIGSILIALLIAGFLVWYDSGATVAALVSITVVFCCVVPTVLSTGRIYNQIDISNNLSEEAQQFKNDSDEALFQVWQRSRVSQPTGFLCWMLFGLSVCLLFFWPMIQLYVDKNFRIATIFLFLGIFSAPRLYLNPVPILRSLGSMSNVDLPPRRQPVKSSTVEPGSARSVLSTILYHEEDTEDEYIMRKKAKLSSIVGTVNNRGSVCGWMWFFGILIIYAGLFALFAFSDGSDALDYKVKVPEGEVLLVDGFYYPGQPKLPYPTCSLSNHDFTLLDPDSPTRLMDVSFLAIMSFSAPEESTPFINHWFGEGQVVDNYEFVYNYRQEIDSLSGASYKLFSFPNNPGVGLVSIRGSESLLDWAVDVQLWTAAGLAQIIRGLIPLGWVWNPILDDLVYLINLVENENLKKISYYTQTTQFVNDLLSQKFGNYTKIRVTGASLGGGLAIITGAQTNASAVAISGLNAMLSRHTFSPPLTEEALNTHVFNVIPDRDPIAAVDDPGDLYQRTQCKAPFNSFFACHSMWRSLCEFSYTCGSQGRPIICWCVSKYGYPKPIQNGTIDFDTACNYTTNA